MPTLNLTGTRPEDWNAIWGGTPVVPSPAASAGTAVQTNLQNLSQILGLAGGVNAANTNAMMQHYGAFTPELSNLMRQSSANIGQHLSGELTDSTVNQLVQMGAERGISGGITNRSPNVNAALLAALGKTAEGLQAQGEQELTASMGRTPQIQPFNIGSMLVSPEAQQSAQYYANLYRSMPRPSARGPFDLNQVRRGLREGGGGIPAPTLNRGLGAGPVFRGDWGGWVGPTSANSLGTGTIYGGAQYAAGSNPVIAAQNWQDWWNAPNTVITGNATGGGADNTLPEEDWNYLMYGIEPDSFSSDSGAYTDSYPEGSFTWNEEAGMYDVPEGYY